MFFGFNVDASGRQFRATLFPKKLFFSKHNFEQITLIIEPHILIICYLKPKCSTMLNPEKYTPKAEILRPDHHPLNRPGS